VVSLPKPKAIPPCSEQDGAAAMAGAALL